MFRWFALSDLVLLVHAKCSGPGGLDCSARLLDEKARPHIHSWAIRIRIRASPADAIEINERVQVGLGRGVKNIDRVAILSSKLQGARRTGGA